MALGEPAEDSDIDHVAVHAGLDLRPSLEPQTGVGRAGKPATGWPIKVMATDLPERKARPALPTAFERHVRDLARLFGLLSH